ncbi:10337_t:CDS:10, partial [Diversispora eburnea]
MWSKIVGQLKPQPFSSIFGGSAPPPTTTPSLKHDKPYGRRSSVGSSKDPRITVARRKTSLLYGVVGEISERNKSDNQSPRKIIPPEQQKELNSLFLQWQNSFDEKDRIFFLIATSRKYFEIFFENPEMLGESLDDLEIFTDAITRYLIDSIRKSLSSENKLQASQDILRMLADETKLFFIIKTINLLCDGPEFIFEIMSAHSLPALLIEIFQCFVEVSSQADYPQMNLGDENHTQKMAPSEVIADILEDILVNFVSISITLTQMLEQDLLYSLITMVITKQSSPGINLWVERVLEVFVELFACATQDVVTYFVNKDIMGTLMKILKSSINMEGNKFIDNGQLIYTGSLLIELIQGALHVSPIFLESFINMNGYETLFYLLIFPPFDTNNVTSKDTLITMVEDLVFAGADELKPVVSQGTPYQHSDFQLPTENEDDDETLFRNEKAFQVLISALLYPDTSFYPFSSDFKISDSIKIPDIFRQKIVVAIAEILKSNQSNYFLIESLNVLPTIIEQLDRFSPKVQRSILDLLVFVMVDLNYVPFRELVVLLLHFQGQSLKHTTAIVCETVTSLLQSSSKFKEVFREIGLLNMLCSLLQDLTTTLQEKFGNTHFARRISISQLSDVLDNQQTESSKIKSRFGPEVIDNFHLISECLVELLKINKTNLSLFGSTYKGNLFDLLQYDETRDGALSIFETLVVEGYVLSNDTDPQTPMSKIATSFSSQSCIEHSFQFGRLIEIVQSLPRFDLKMKRHILLSMKRILVSCPDMKDVFRESGGFVCLVSLLVGLEDIFKLLANPNSDEQNSSALQSFEIDELPSKSQAIDLLKAIFLIFAEAMSNHDSNRRFFDSSIGYISVKDAICLTDILSSTGSPEHLFGILFSFAIENEFITEVFIDDISNTENISTNNISTNNISTTNLSTTNLSTTNLSMNNEAEPSKIVKMLGNLTDEIRNPSIIPTIMDLQLYVNHNPKLGLKIYEALLALSYANRRNQVMMNKSGVLEIVLRRLFPALNDERKNIDPQEKQFLTRLAQRLIEMGVSTTEIRFLFEQFENGNQQPEEINTNVDGTLMTVMDMVLFGVQRSRWPRFVQFDMCQFGYSCLEMNNLSDRQFPPANGGYTFMTWLDIENFDLDINLTLLGLSDDENRCYLHIYIEAQTHRLIAQSSPGRGARFDSFEFRTGCWYHIALVHNKPRIGSPSSISLYVDGRFVEIVKCPYLGQPAPNKAIRSYIGTPIDVARKIGKGYAKLVWDLGPCYFFEDDLDGDIISVYYHLGPRYSSNFQDSLGQFQTYQTSTLLNMRVEALSRQRKDSNIELDHLAMVNAIRGNNSQTLPEDKIIFAFNASNVLVCGQNTSILGAGLSEGTSQALAIGTANTKVILNAAVPKVERALRVPHGLAYLRGDPVTAVPYGMDDSIWKIGGSAVVLRMIERAETATDLFKTVCTLIELIRFSWRNSEDMERIHGYEILAYLLKQKHGLLTMELLNLLLVFVGLNPLSHNDSVIINPLAYRFLILDFDLWRHSHESVQRAHLHQFSIFIQLSQHHHFNAKRLSKMHVVKKMLVALKTNIYQKELLTDFIATLKIVVKYNFTTEVIRSIATFLVSTLNKSSPTRRLARKESPLKTGMTVTFSHENAGKTSSKTIVTDVRSVPVETMAKHIGVMVMEMLTEIVCDKLNPFYVNKFATTITNKWPLLFFSEDSNPFWVVCAARILSRLFHSQGTNYINKFRTSSEGFTVMQKLLPQWWYLTQLQQTLFTMLFGVDICDVPIDAPFDLFSLLTLFRAKDDTTHIVVPDVMPIILLMLKEGINTIVQMSYDVEKDISAKGKSQDDAVIQRKRSSSKHQRQRSRSLTRDLETFNGNDDKPTKETLSKLSHVEQTFIHFLTDMHNNSTEFSELCYKSEIMDVFIEILFPIVCACDEVSIETELYSKEFGLSFDADSTFEKLLSNNLSNNGVSGVLPVLNTFLRQSKHFFDEEHGEEMKSFSSNPMIITTEPFQDSPYDSPTRSSPTQSDLEDEPDSLFVGIRLPERKEKKPEYEEHKNTTVESLLEFIVSICVNSILDVKTKQLAGLDIVLRSFPPSFLEHQIQLESYILLHVLGSLKSTLQLDMNLLNDHRIVANVARFSQMATDTIYQGWFLDGCNQMYDFITIVLEGIQRIDEPIGKRFNDQWISILYRSLDRIILFKLSEIDQTSTKTSVIIEILEKLIYHQKVIFSPFNTDPDFLKCLCYHLYKFLLYDHQEVKTNSTSIWKLLMLQKPIEMSGILKTRVKGIEYKELVEGFAKLLEMDLKSFLEWIEARKIQLDALFQENISRVWESLILSEIKSCKESLKNIHSKRMSKLKKLYKKASIEQDFFNQYRIKTNQWSRHIQEIETGRYYKSIQDNIDHYNYVRDEWAKTSTDLFRERALWGRCRMRKKLERNEDPRLYSYRPKSCKYENIEKEGESPQSSPMTKSTTSLEIPGNRLKKVSDRQMTLTPSSPINANDTEPSFDVESVGNSQYTESQADFDDENAFEEDKNRKVLRSLEHGDAVLDIYNISRIIGLDAC